MKKKKCSQEVPSIFSVVVDHLTTSKHFEEWVETLLINTKYKSQVPCGTYHISQ